MYQNMQKIESSSFFIGRNDPNVISFGSGQPDLPPPPGILSVPSTYTHFKYGPIGGQQKLKEALAKHYPGTAADEFVITNGASEALDLVLRALSGVRGRSPIAGGKILLFRPYYYSYPFNVKFAGMEAVYSDMKDGRIDLEDFHKKITGCRAVLVNSPANPTGRVELPETLRAVEEATRVAGVKLIFDNVYKDLIYDGEHYLPRGEHVILLDSFSKSYAMCGLRVGFLQTSDKKLIQDAIEIKVHTSMNTDVMAQDMACAALATPDFYLTEMAAIWRGRRDILYEDLKSLGLDLWKPEGAFYMLPRVPDGDSARAVSELYFNHNVIVYDGEWFGAPGCIRLSYALDAEKIKEGVERIGAWLKSRK